MNTLKVFVLMAGLTALFVALGGYFGGSGGMVTALVLAAIVNFVMYYASSSLVLRMYGAQVVTEPEAPDLYAMVDRLRQRAGLPMPTLGIAPHAQPNAFATGRNPRHSVVCVTDGILNVVTPDELEGVLAHELSHVRNRDMLVGTIAATLAAAISNIANLGLWFGGASRDDENGSPAAGLAMAILAPIGAMLIQFAISRQREFGADRDGARLTGRPLALASALEKIDAYAHRIPMNVSPAVAPLALVNPLAAYGGGIVRLFSTHPPTEERVARLRAMAQAA